MAKRKGKFKTKNSSGSYDQVMLETEAGQIVDGPFKSLERGATYVIGDVAVEATCPGAFLVCTTAGKTAASVPSGYTSAAHFGTVTDGAAKFQVHFFKNVDEVATQAEAEAGTNNIKVMTALRVAQAMAKFMSTWGGNEYIRKHVVTATSTGQNGYIKFGDWFGGLILQWGLADNQHDGGYAQETISFPIPFSTSCYCVIGNTFGDGAGVYGHSIYSKKNNNFVVLKGVAQFVWIALGS